MSRFNIEDIRQVAMTYNKEHDEVEFCAIDLRGVIHWMTEDEHNDVKTSIKARSNAVFVLRENEEDIAVREERDKLKNVLNELVQDGTIASETLKEKGVSDGIE